MCGSWLHPSPYEQERRHGRQREPGADEERVAERASGGTFQLAVETTLELFGRWTFLWRKIELRERWVQIRYAVALLCQLIAEALGEGDLVLRADRGIEHESR